LDRGSGCNSRNGRPATATEYSREGRVRGKILIRWDLRS
jgi:hypothetical protein